VSEGAGRAIGVARHAQGDGARGVPGPPPGPGGLPLIDRAFSLAGLPPGARVVDVGCGAGRSVEHLRRGLGLDAVGVDLDLPERHRRAGPQLPLVRARGERLPFPDGAAAAVLLECVLSVAADRERLLSECARVLAPGGTLVVADLYAPRPASGWTSPGPAGGAALLTREALAHLLELHGLGVVHWEDHSSVLKEYLFRFVMERGPVDDLWRYLGGASAGGRDAAGALRELRPGYLLLLAVKDR
jgi:arsenite methyltransferase